MRPRWRLVSVLFGHREFVFTGTLKECRERRTKFMSGPCAGSRAATIKLNYEVRTPLYVGCSCVWSEGIGDWECACGLRHVGPYNETAAEGPFCVNPMVRRGQC